VYFGGIDNDLTCDYTEAPTRGTHSGIVYLQHLRRGDITGEEEASSMHLKRSRPGMYEHFLDRAKVVADGSTRLRRKVGAIIVNKDR
jgi:hypothetical protein